MKIKTSELSGVALDWAVGISRGLQIGNHNGIPYRKDLPGDTYGPGPAWRPSTDWSQGGPLIAKYLMDFCVDHPHTIGAALCDENGMYMNMLFGETHLIAACRAIVAAKLGDEVDVPEGLV